MISVPPSRNLHFAFAGMFWTALVATCVLAGRGMLAESAGTTNGSKSTEVRLQAPGWWPRKGDRPRNEYVGAAVCIGCHDSKASFKDSAMAHASARAADAESLRLVPFVFQIGPYRYQITDAGGKKVLRISKRGASDSAVLLWAFGMGRIAQTYIYEQKGRFYEGHLSFFSALHALDITPGHPRTEPPSLEEGLGRLIPVEETRRCFGCHTTASTTKDGFDPRTPFPGVTCEACHGPGAKHVAAMKDGDYELAMSSIMNPAQLNPVESVDFCGACHRTWQDVILDSPVKIGPLNVRFQPYRLENSRCWKEGKGDARITCVGCHDPHQSLAQDPKTYDAKCLQCHLAAGAGAEAEKNDRNNKDDHRTACPIGVKLCVTCHMPRFKNPFLHTTFTDHWIRIASSEAPLPD